MSIILNHVSYIYPQSSEVPVRALDDVSLQIDEGELLAIIGHTGSGKSTLVQHLNGLLRPSEGTILLDGEDVNAKDYDRRSLRAKVGLVFQYPEYQLFETDVFRDVCFGPLNQGLTAAEAEARAYSTLELAGFPREKWYVSPFELSGGEKRRVAIAGILAMKPRYLVLDEPTAGLDPAGRREILVMLKAMAEAGIGVVLVSHSMDDVAEYAGRVAVMDKGRIVMNDTPDSVFRRREELEAMGLGVPEISRIMSELFRQGLSSTDFALTIDEATERLLQEYLHSTNNV